jgi:hypothetical protein
LVIPPGATMRANEKTVFVYRQIVRLRTKIILQELRARINVPHNRIDANVASIKKRFGIAKSLFEACYSILGSNILLD